MHDPKFDPGWGFTYYCEPTPGRHTVSCNQYLEMQPVKKQFASRLKAVPKTAGTNKYTKKAHRIAVGSYYKMLVDCAGICLFGTQAGGNMPIGDWINAATGWDLSHDEYLRIGEHAEQLRHAFNIREGINPLKDFRPHPGYTGANLSDPVR